MTLLRAASIILSTAIASVTTADATLNHTDRGAFVSPAAAGLISTDPDGFSSGDPAGGGEVYHARGFNGGPFTGNATVETDRNFHIFDLANLAGTINGATLRIWADVDALQSLQTAETLGLFSVSSPAETLSAPTTANGGAGVYGDLGSGTPYNDTSTDNVPDVESQYIDFVLNTAAIADLNAAVGVGPWSVGGSILSIDGVAPGTSERIFKNDSSTDFEPPALLVLTGSVFTVPEPNTVALLAASVVGLLRWRKR